MSAIDDKYNWLLENVVNLGVPTGPEVVARDGVGSLREYQYGTILYHPKVGAYEIHGAIAARYAQLDRERSILGYPISDETDVPDGSGRFNDFEFGRITWTRSTSTLDVLETTPYAIMRVETFIDCVEKVEAAYQQDTPEMVLTRIRQQYYPDPTLSPAAAIKFDTLLPDAPNFVGTTRRQIHPVVVGTTVYNLLQARADENGLQDNPSPYMLDGERGLIDIGHALLTLDALLHPRATSPYDNYGIKAIDPASWIADLALASFWTTTHARDGQPKDAPKMLPSADFDGYYRMSAPDSDLLGDADGFGLFQVWQAVPGQRFSQVLRRYYLADEGNFPGYRSRWRTFCTANALTYTYEIDTASVDWDSGIGDQWIRRINRLCDLFDDGWTSGLPLWIDPNVRIGNRRSWPYAGTAFSTFRNWLTGKLQAELVG